MVDRDDINRLTSATRTVLDEARRDLMSLAAQFDLANPAQVRDALLELVPMLVNEYGELAAVAAAEWYEDVRPVGGFTTQLADVADEAAARGSVQALAGGLWDDVPSDAIEQISASMERHIKYSSRATIARNVAADPMRPRYGRVPKGAKTCAWCEMLASRGFVYVTEETAGIVEDHYHDECDCEIVCSWDADQAHIAGYDPDAMYDRYLTARQELEAEGILSPNDQQIARRMRDMFPEQYTDSRTVPSILTSKDSGWPTDSVPPLTEKAWQHILHRHGPDGTAQSLFDGLSDYEIAKKIRAVAGAPQLRAPHPKNDSITNLYGEINREVIVVGVTHFSTPNARVSTAFPPASRSPIMEVWRTWQQSQ